MTVSLVFLTLLMVTFGGWLVWPSFNARPWESQAVAEGPAVTQPEGMTAGRVGLVVFLAVVTSLFALTISAYMMRMEISGDWRPLPVPGLLWFNTGALLLGSLALQWAWNGAQQGDDFALEKGLLVGGVGTWAFVLGQLVVWYQLIAAGYYMASNPANAFFYLLTALHGLHLLGGLVVWARLLVRRHQGAAPVALCSRMELCTLYWHYLLVIWFILFGLLLFG
ncbi:cytochrome c oxidase subunit 3 [Aidingimonas halophila]|uniref:Cytochrome c oxidase subunit 3 n=1 Tax=Aidingimonas halophila TaxID=574349 RepID=A0A1H3BZB5_9GAMM|nr:cytochrome c oxidase subunit 3 [Aidingimonas halophila]GHC27369.1 cytochrome-c oxidase [Aidingimonas halophila]SDX47263.1 cytochrome c oxidase subunit 3 [Aidingimonas halophila]